MLGKLFSLLITFFISRAAGQPPTTANAIGISVVMLRRMSVMMVMFAVGTLLLFGGFLTILADLILASYTIGAVTLTNVSWVGAGLMLVAALTYSVTFTDRFWRPVAKPEIYTSPMNAAIASLINDFVSERREHRAAAIADHTIDNGIHHREAERRAYMS
jgi:hypothetical protein